MRDNRTWLAMLFLFFFVPAPGNANPTLFNKQNSCHYDEVLKMDVWVSYAPDYAVLEFKKLIKKKYNKNIDVYVNRVLSPDEFYDRVRAGISDVISPSHNFFKDEGTRLIETGLLMPLNETDIPNMKDLDPWFATKDFASYNGKVFGVPVAAGGYNLLYRKDQFKDSPKSWAMLWDESYKGKYALSGDYYEANVYLTALVMGYRADQISDIRIVNTPAFKAKLKQLLQNANFWHGRPTAAAVKDSVLTSGWGLSFSVAGDTRKNWRLAFPKEGVGFWTDYLAITRNTKRSELAQILAKEWLNFSIGQQFQVKTVIRERNYISTLKAGALPKDILSIQSVREREYVFSHAVPWPLLSARNRNGIKLVYDEVMKEIKR